MTENFLNVQETAVMSRVMLANTKTEFCLSNDKCFTQDSFLMKLLRLNWNKYLYFQNQINSRQITNYKKYFQTFYTNYDLFLSLWDEKPF